MAICSRCCWPQRDDEAGEADHALSSDELRDQVLTLFLAGYETVANLLAWTWLLLGQNPEAETELHAEIDDVLGGRPAALDDLPKLEYTAMVLAEAMRLYPPAWAMGREALEDVSIGPVSAAEGNLGFLQPIHCAAESALVSGAGPLSARSVSVQR